MASNEERVMILRMIEEGKISADEGTRLLAAFGQEETKPVSGQATDIGGSGRSLRIRVSDSITGAQKVNINIPTGLVSFGLQFIPASADFDPQTIRQAMESGLTGRIIDIQDDEDGQRVEVFLE